MISDQRLSDAEESQKQVHYDTEDLAPSTKPAEVAPALTPEVVRAIDAKSKKTAILDGFLVIVFQFVGQLGVYAITLLPFLDTFQQGRYSWVKFPLGILLGALIKALDRKKHEDATPSNGLIDFS
jgi:hypothetical protein